MKETLSKEQMKAISGGYGNSHWCQAIINVGCGGGTSSFSCSGSSNGCDAYAAEGCYADPCCVGWICN